MILYIHGFGSSSFGLKSEIVKEYFGRDKVISPSLSHIPDLAVDTLEQIVNIFPNIGVIGSSLGGYYAMHLTHKFGVKSVLINPAVTPYITLQRAVPVGINYFDNSRYDFKTEYLSMLKNIEVERPDISKSLLLLQKGDEVLNYRDAENIFRGGNLILEESGDHGFQNFESKLSTIKDFLEI